MVELSARAFEAFIYFKMEAVGMSNDYLVNFKTLDEYDRSDCYPYPTREEAETFAPFFESFFDAVFSTEERSNIVALPVCAAPAIAAIPEVEVIQVEEIPTYEEVEKSPFFPEALADHRKYFAAVETFCNSFNLIYHFDLLNEKKVRLFVMFLNGEKVFFDYEVTSRHRDVFAFREHDEKRRRLKNWSVAIETMKKLLNQPSGTSPEGTTSGAAPDTEIVTYGDTEKSLPMPIAASESTASSDRRPPVILKGEDETRMDDLNQKNGYCIAHEELLRLGSQHEKDFNRKHFYSCELIEYRLTNINCHSYCGLLYAGKYEEFKEMVNKQIKEEDMKATDNIAYGVSEQSPIEVKAQFIRHLDGEDIEMYKITFPSGSVQYWGRDNQPNDPYEWFMISDAPNGYCEKSFSISPAIKIQICDNNGNVLYNTYNGAPPLLYTFRDVVDQVLEAVPNITEQVSDRLREYLTPFLESADIKDGTDRMNFYECRYSLIDTQELFTFTWMGHLFSFLVESYKHTLCPAHWQEVVIRDKADGGIWKRVGDILPPYGDAETSPIRLLPQNISLQLVADTCILGDKESQNAAKKIIASGMESDFAKWRAKDPDANCSPMDFFDTVVGFPIHNSEVRLYGDCVELKYLQFFGMKPEESLRKLFDYANGKDYELMDECSFKLRGVKGFLPYNSYLFHQCFAEGRITVDELIKMLQEQED